MNPIVVRAAAGAAGLMLTLAACGTAAAPASLGEPAFPAAVLIDPDLVDELVPEATVVPQATQTASPDVVEPTTFARPERSQGPPGNPSAQSLDNPPTPGNYPFRAIAQGDFGQQETEFEFIVDSFQNVGRGKRQVQRYDVDGFVQEFQYLWTPGELLLERAKTTGFDGSTNECEYDPPALVIDLPLHVDASWEYESACGDQQVRSTSTVIRTEVVDIGGAAVDTFVIETVTRSGGQKQTSTSWYAPAPRLMVIIETTIEGEDFGTIETVVEALSIRPATA